LTTLPSVAAVYDRRLPERVPVPSKSGSVFGVFENLTEDKLESEQTDLENARPAFFLLIPIQFESERLRMAGKRGFSIRNKEDASRIEIIHRPPTRARSTLITA
jgi:hypothetical protein